MNAFPIPTAVVERLGWVLVHSAWEFALVALLAGVIVRAMRRNSAATRYGVLVVAMAVSVAAPVVTWVLQPSDVPDRSASQGASALGQESNAATRPGADAARLASDSDSAHERDSFPEDIRRTGGVSPLVAAESNDVPSTRRLTPPVRQSSWAERAKAVVRPWLAWIVAAWSLGVVACSLRPLLGWHTLWRLKRVGVLPVSDEVLATMRRMSNRLGLYRPVRVLQSALAQVPVVVGYLRPVILLPVSLMTSIPAAQLEAILAHELAHVRRHDFVVNLLQTLVETLFFYHPAVWWLSRQIRVEREHCCDDLVVASLGSRIEYGRALLAIEELRGARTVLALGAADGSLLSRVHRIVGIAPDHAAVRLSDRWPVAFVTLGCLLAIALGTFVSSRAEMETPAAEDASNLRAGRGSSGAGRGSPDPALDPTAGLPNSDEETNPPNNATGDLRFNPAAGSGDPRRAQGELRTLRKPALLLPDHWIVMAVGFDNGGKELVTASNQSFITIRRWDVVGMKLISEIKLQADQHGRTFREGTLLLSGDRRRVLAATDAYVGIWETATGKLLKQLPFKTKEGIYDCAINRLDCTPDLSVIVGHRALPGRSTLSYDAHVMVWDGVSGNVLQTVIDKGATDLKALDLSTDGKRLVTTNGSGAKIWETSTGKLLHSVPNDNTGRKHSDPDVSSQYTSHVWSVQFSPDGKQLAMGDILGVKLLDATSGKLLQQLDGPYRYSSSGGPGLVFSKDGQRLARLGTQEKVFGNGDKHRYVVPIWSTRTGAKLFELHTEANDAAFSDDGQRLAIVYSDMQQALSVWPLSGDAANVEQTAGPGPHSRQDRVEENGHYVGKTAAELIDKFQPTWGDTQLGLQYGIALTKPQPQLRGRDGVPTYKRGERVPLVVFFRNTSDKPIKFDTAPDFFGNTPKILNAKGEPIALENIPLLGHVPHYHERLAPGEALGPFYLNFGLGENPRPGQQHWHPYFKTPVAGKYKVTHSVSIHVESLEGGEKSKNDQITSGQIEFEIVDAVEDAKFLQASGP